MFFLEKLRKVSVYSKLNILFQGINFSFFFILLRLFSIEEIGIISYNESFIVLLSTFLVFGLDNYLTRYFLKFNKEQRKVIIGTVLTCTTSLVLITEIVFCILIWLIGQERIGDFFFNISVQILIFSSFVSALIQIQYSLVRIQNDLMAYILNNVIQFVIKYVVILGYCILTVFNVKAYFTGVLIFNILCSIYVTYVISHQVTFSFRFQSIKRILGFSTPLMFNNLISIGVVFIERVLVKTLFGASILGFFGFASKLSNAILSFHAALKVEYVPAILKVHLTGTDGARKLIQKLSVQNIIWLFFVSLFVGILGISLYLITMPILVTGFFILAAVILQAFLNAIPLYSFPNLFLRGKTIFYFKSQISLLFTYLPLLGVLIYLFDYYGFFASLVLRSSLYLFILYIIIGKQEK